MKKLLKLSVAWMSLTTMLFLSVASTAFAFSFSQTTTQFVTGSGYKVTDMEVDSSGNTHTALVQTSGGSYVAVAYSYNGGSPTQVEALTQRGDPAGYPTPYPKIALDSSNNPALAWTDWTDSASSYIKYEKKSADWSGSAVTVYTNSGSVNSGYPAFDFYNDGGDADYPSIVTCIHASYDVVELKATTSTPSGSGDFSASQIAALQTGRSCSSADMYITSSDAVILLTGPNSDDGSGYAYGKTGPSFEWTEEATAFTNFDVGSSDSAVVRIKPSGANAVAVILDADYNNDSTEDDPAIYYNARTSGSWGSQALVATGGDIYESIDVVVDSTESVDWIFYFDNANDSLDYAVNYTGGWSGGSLDYTFDTIALGGNYYNTLAGGYDSSTQKIYVISSMRDSGGFDLAESELSLLSYSEGGVPEFSTYVYIVTILVAFGLIYKKLEIGKVFAKS